MLLTISEEYERQTPPVESLFQCSSSLEIICTNIFLMTCFRLLQWRRLLQWWYCLWCEISLAILHIIALQFIFIHSFLTCTRSGYWTTLVLLLVGVAGPNAWSRPNLKYAVHWGSLKNGVPWGLERWRNSPSAAPGGWIPLLSLVWKSESYSQLKFPWCTHGKLAAHKWQTTDMSLVKFLTDTCLKLWQVLLLAVVSCMYSKFHGQCVDHHHSCWRRIQQEMTAKGTKCNQEHSYRQKFHLRPLCDYSSAILS